MRRVVLGGALLYAVTLVSSGESHAGDRKVEVLFANMTPDGLSSEASKTCVRQLEAVIKAGYANVQRIGETALRKQVGKAAGEAFMDWPAVTLAQAKQRKGVEVEYIDTVILVDCRPETKSLAVLVYPPSASVARIRLRGAMGRDAVEWVAKTVLARGWSGFSP